MTIYFMSLVRLPKIVKTRLERIQREFLWGGGALEKKPHLVNWSIVCLVKKKGGLRCKGSVQPEYGAPKQVELALGSLHQNA